MGEGSYKIIWSSEARIDFLNVIDYLLTNWPEKVVNDFIDKVDHKLRVLSAQPFIGILSEKDPTVRSVLLSKQNRMYYSVSERTIELLNIFDTRQNPEKNIY